MLQNQISYKILQLLQSYKIITQLVTKSNQLRKMCRQDQLEILNFQIKLIFFVIICMVYGDLHNPEKHYLEWTRSRVNTTLNGHDLGTILHIGNPKWT